MLERTLLALGIGGNEKCDSPDFDLGSPYIGCCQLSLNRQVKEQHPLKKVLKHEEYVHKKLFGFKVGDKRYRGLIKKYEGKIVGSNVFMIPPKHYNIAKSCMQKKKVAFEIYDIWKE